MAAPFVKHDTSQYAHRPSCDCVDCQDARRVARNPHLYGYEERPGANIPIRAYIIGLALSAVIILVGFAILWSVPGYAREGGSNKTALTVGSGHADPTRVAPIRAPRALVKARAACPTDSIPCLHGKLRRAYESIAWQRSARQHAQATTVQDITRDAIAWASAKYHVSAADMTSVGICESHLWPFATNGQYAGAWQLSPRHREDPIFAQVPWQDAYAEASHVARYVHAHGWGEWQCQPGGGLRW